MSAFIIKVTLEDGQILPPLTAIVTDHQQAKELIRELDIVGQGDKVEYKELDEEVLKAVYGEQPHGTVVLRHVWISSGDMLVY